MSAASRILIVDDAPANLQALSAILRERQYQISIATHGRQALEVLGRVRPDLILLDVLMPEMDGYETCAQIKAVPAWRDIPIIFLTAKSDTGDIVRGFELGAVDYVAKPFHAHELLARVHTHLSMDRLRRENERLVRDESELARHRSVAQMVAGVAHEINTPLGVINTAADLIRKRLDAPQLAALAADPDGQYLLDDLRDAANLIGRNAARAAKLVQDFKKVSVNQITDVRESIVLAELLNETVHLFRVSERSSPMTVAIDNALGAANWTGYAGSLSQVLLNLLSNAQRYAYPNGAGGRVDVLLDQDPEAPQTRYRIRVRDHGLGIAPEHLPRIFEPFYTTGRGKGGSGLGLAIVYTIVTVHLQGAIRVESTPGVGTCFTLSLPQQVAE
ncbi:MAG: hybrid sensor histidine kinase/response regulator [Lysobacterales bacterium]